MPVSAAIGATALAGAGLQGLWQYNRDNYFFDVPLEQNRRFQLQNIGMARFALFREDLRDLAALTTDKVQNYFVVNTLKLGFIVTIFFNFDRVDEEAARMNHVEEQINLIFSMTLMTSFFWLLTSIWFSMHAVMLAESITTKMLVQSCRIPLPTTGEVKSSATDARHFETDLNVALRVPLFGEGLRARLQRVMRGGGAASDQRPPEGCGAPGLGAEAEGARRLWRGGSPGQPVPEPQVQSFNSDGADALRCGARIGRGPKGPGLVGLPIWDVLDRRIDAEYLSKVDTSLEPHLKFYRLIRPTWTGFDLYGKIAMEIGTANLCSGLAYYAIFYMRDKADSFSVNPGGWVAFSFLSVLAWFSLILDLQISFLAHVALACVMLCAWISTACYISLPEAKAHGWLLSVVVVLQALWVQAVCWSGAGFGSHYPTAWRATRFLNVLHMEEEPAPFQQDHLDVKKESAVLHARGSLRHSPRVEGAMDAQSEVPEEDPTSQDEDESEEGIETDMLQAFAAAFPLLHCLGVALETVPLGKHRKTVHAVRDRLYEAARAAGALPVGTGSTETVGLIKPFRILLPPHNKKASSEEHLLDMCRGNLEVMGDEHGFSRVTLSELLGGAKTVSDILFADSKTWTVRDMQRFARYGGEPVPGVASFLAQFHERGSRNNHFLGSTAKNLFRMGVFITAGLWLGCCLWSVNLSLAELRLSPADSSGRRGAGGERDADVPEAVGRRVPMVPPRPWLLPSSMGCDSAGSRLVLADADGAFVGSSSGTWRRPSRPCWGAEVLSADFGPRGRLWLSTTLGVHEEQRVQRNGSRLCTPQPTRAPKLEKMALDSAPHSGSRMPGLALAGGRLHALEADPIEGWSLAGTVAASTETPVVGLAIHAGRALVLDSAGAVHQLSSLTGRWEDPVLLPKDYRWRGICALAEGGDWLVLGSPARDAGVQELWRFSPPAPQKKALVPLHEPRAG